jgi:hypothetical protein
MEVDETGMMVVLFSLNSGLCQWIAFKTGKLLFRLAKICQK